MIKITCNSCNNSIEVNEHVAVGLGCTQCGGQSIIFDVPVKRTCLEVGCLTVDEIKGGAPVHAYHMRGHHTYLLASLAKPKKALKKIKEVIKEVKQEKTTKRRPLRRKK